VVVDPAAEETDVLPAVLVLVQDALDVPPQRRLRQIWAGRLELALEPQALGISAKMSSVLEMPIASSIDLLTEGSELGMYG